MSSIKRIVNKMKHYFKYDFMTGHITIGNLTMYGRNAMHWGCHIYTKKYGYICFRLPLFDEGWHELYLYFSPNATPWAATFMLGRKKSRRDDWVKSRIRYSCFGHNFNMDEYDEEYGMTNREINRGINNMVSSTKWVYQNYAREHGCVD